MASVAAISMNTSAHALPDLKAYAQAAPDEAAAYLQHVADGLREAGQTQPADSIAAILSATGALVDRVTAGAAQLGLIFPEVANGWGDLQTRRAATIGWTAAPPAKPQVLQGTVSLNPANNVLQLTTPGGKTYQLADSTTPKGWAAGVQAYVGDGNVSLQGRVGADGLTFNVIDSAPNQDGKFTRFISGRTHLMSPTEIRLLGPAGEVFLTNPELVNRIKSLEDLYLIVPGEPKLEGGRLVYTENPPELVVVARPTIGSTVLPIAQLPPEVVLDVPVPANAVAFGRSDTAHSLMANAPTTVPAGMEGRFTTPYRNFMRGSFVNDATGKAVRFDASYVSLLPIEGTPAANGTTVPDADPVQAAVLLAE